ncbi:uncharacterized protein JCM15063_002409 [Sporobolomyces koalae]|uniref:uncharacterized protein n=1 Tax=Sporobolomyces koalae TaxID=500713 RepID=UPI00316C29F2
MPPVFGGAPSCPTCNKSVYFAEQTLGPGGRAFHKICLKCVACGKLLEPRLLVDHDGEAYCKACHGKSFGTRGYGAGGALVGEYHPRSSPTRPVTNSVPNSPSPASPARPVPATSSVSTSNLASLSSRPSVPPKPVFSARTTSGSRPPLPPLPSSRGEAVSTPPTSDQFPVATDRAAPSNPALSMPSKSTPAFSDDDEDDASQSTSNVRSANTAFPPSQFAPRSLSSSGDLCRRCGTQVYFAEQVIAVGSKWHKRCLRCTSCSTTLNSHLLEKDRLPYCKKCYQEKFGTGSLGITSVRLENFSLLLAPHARNHNNLTFTISGGGYGSEQRPTLY